MPNFPMVHYPLWLSMSLGSYRTLVLQFTHIRKKKVIGGVHAFLQRIMILADTTAHRTR